jgi:hypothetical protein
MLIACHYSNSDAKVDQTLFEKECAGKDSTTNIIVDFMGFTNEEFDSVLVREYSDTIPVDSFMLYVAPEQSTEEKPELHRTATINEWLQLDHIYHFCVPGRRPFVLSQMELVTVSYLLTPDSLDCLLGDYLVDGERSQNSSIRLIK